jgi:cleavage stimulation factor subunit 1
MCHNIQSSTGFLTSEMQTCLLIKFIDLEFETDVQTTAPEPALYETAYVTSHKGNCRAGAFSVDGQLIATGSVDASIKAGILF